MSLDEDDDLHRLPGLYRPWELGRVLRTGRLYRLELAGECPDGAPLLAVYEGVPAGRVPGD